MVFGVSLGCAHICYISLSHVVRLGCVDEHTGKVPLIELWLLHVSALGKRMGRVTCIACAAESPSCRGPDLTNESGTRLGTWSSRSRSEPQLPADI